MADLFGGSIDGFPVGQEVDTAIAISLFVEGPEPCLDVEYGGWSCARYDVQYRQPIRRRGDRHEARPAFGFAKLLGLRMNAQALALWADVSRHCALILKHDKGTFRLERIVLTTPVADLPKTGPVVLPEASAVFPSLNFATGDVRGELPACPFPS